jgi:uncharacterized protein
MALHIILMLFAAGVIGGIITSLVGGAAVVTYPALIAAGLPPLSATVCNLTAAAPGAFFAALSDRGQLPPFDRAFVAMCLASTLGAGAGGLLLLATPMRVFEILVPILLGFATVLFAFSGRVSDWLKARAAQRGHEIAFNVTSLKALLPVSFYNGYFGVGSGVLTLGVLSLATEGDYRSANVAKNLVTGLNCAAAALIFIVRGRIDWPPTLALMAGTAAGGILGASLARVAPRALMRIAVVLVGAALTMAFAWRYWF